MEQTTTKSKANTWMRQVEQDCIARGWKRGNKTGSGVIISPKLCEKLKTGADNERVKTKVKYSPEVAPVVHGHFIHDGPRFAGGVDWWHCSNCGKLVSGVEIFFNYCPYCGARMDKRRTHND